MSAGIIDYYRLLPLLVPNPSSWFIEKLQASWLNPLRYNPISRYSKLSTNLPSIENLGGNGSSVEQIRILQDAPWQRALQAGKEQHAEASMDNCISLSSLPSQQQARNDVLPLLAVSTTAESFAITTNGKRPKLSLRLKRGWPKVIALNCLANFVALTCNTVLLLWASKQSPGSPGTYTIWEGSESSQFTVKVLIHIMINIMSTAILAGSSYSLQVLLAPSRKQIDIAHSQQRSLDIGLSSFRNWLSLSLRKKILYSILVILMLPIHLFYNSIIISTSPSLNIESAGVLTSDFLQIPPADSAYLSVWNAAKQGQQWVRLASMDCGVYLSRDVYPLYSNLLIITNINSTTFDSIYNGETSGSINGSLNSWIATFQVAVGTPTLNLTAIYGSLCFPDLSLSVSLGTPSCFSPAGLYTNTQVNIGVEYCLVESIQAMFTLELIPQLLLIVIVCNAIKILLLSLVILSNLEPLVTTGDAIASFLDYPDPVTQDIGPLSTGQFFKIEINQKFNKVFPTKTIYGKPWKAPDDHYLDGVKQRRWCCSLFSCFAIPALFCSLIMLVTLSWQSNTTFSTTSGTLFEAVGKAPSVLLVNSPQILLAIIYMLLNSLWTGMMLSKELVSYSRQKQGLRVTRPEGNQRGTLFLSLPTRYFVPLFLLSLVCHWVMSLTLFVTQINVFESDRTSLPASQIRGVNCWIMGSVTIASLILTVSFGTYFFGLRRHRFTGPLIGCNSVCISAACHPFINAGQRESVKKLTYGVIGEPSLWQTRVAFTGGEARPLIPGETYGPKI